MSEKPNQPIYVVIEGRPGAATAGRLCDYARDGYEVIGQCYAGQDNLGAPYVVWTLRLRQDAVNASADEQEGGLDVLLQSMRALEQRVAMLEDRADDLQESIMQLSIKSPLERITALERRIEEIQALNHSRAQVINDQGDRIEKLEAQAKAQDMLMRCETLDSNTERMKRIKALEKSMGKVQHE